VAVLGGEGEGLETYGLLPDVVVVAVLGMALILGPLAGVLLFVRIVGGLLALLGQS